ncbi:MAG: MotE family protein [Hyphomonadaceae bacterium]
MSARKSAASVRLLPALMVTIAAVVGLKAVAVAEGAEEAAHDAQASSSASEPQTQSASTEGAAAQCAPDSFAEQAGLSQSEVQVLQALGARREQLDQRAAEIETRADLLTAAERRMDQRIQELRRIEGQVGQMLGQLDEAQEQRMANLVDVYQRMRAKDAAAVFDTLDERTLIEVSSRMRQANLAEVMGRMSPDRARRLTQMLAERAQPATDGAALLSRANPTQTASR